MEYSVAMQGIEKLDFSSIYFEHGYLACVYFIMVLREPCLRFVI